MSDTAIVVDEVVTRTPAPVPVRVPVAFGSAAAMWREVVGLEGVDAALTGVDNRFARVPHLDDVTGYFADEDTLRIVETPAADTTPADAGTTVATDSDNGKAVRGIADGAHNFMFRGRPRGRPV